MLARNSGFTLAAVLSLALGIGANTTIFSVANGLLLRPLPVSEPDRLVKIWTSFEHGSRATVSSYPDYADLRDGPSGFSDVAAYFYFPVSVSAAGQPEVVAGGLVSPNYFEVLGVEPVRGRGFRSGEDDELPAAVVSHSLWRRSLRDDPDTIGRKILINGHPFTVIGVAPEGFTSTTTGMAPDVWFPVRLADVALPLELDIDDREVRWLRMVGRLQPETSLAQAQAAADVAAKRLKAEHPDTNGDATFTLMDASEGRFFTVEMGKLAASGAGLLMALVGLVLLIACSNVTCLYLMRAVTREREMAMRAVLGGGRWRITRQLLVESLLVSGLAGGAGILLAVWLLELVRIPDFGPIPIHVDVGLDWSVCAFTAVVSLATGLLLGIVPALRSGGLDLTSALKHGRSGSGARPSRARLQSALVSLQVALCLTLLVAAGLCAMDLKNIAGADLGFDVEHTLIADLNLTHGSYTSGDIRGFTSRLLTEIRRLPGVDQAAFAYCAPLMKLDTYPARPAGYQPAEGERTNFHGNAVSSGFFETLDIPILAGRPIEEGDSKDTEPVVVVNRTFAQRFWPGENAVGRMVNIRQPHRIVGVARDVKYGHVRQASEPYVYIAMNQRGYLMFTLHVRAASNPAALVAPVSRVLRGIDPNLPFQVRTVAKHVDNQGYLDRLFAGAIGCFALVALVLAVVGVYGVMSYAVRQRSREFGIRSALGAREGRIVREVVRKGLTITLAGIAVGLFGAIGLSRILVSQLFGVRGFEAVIIAAMSLGLIVIALLACYIPARWAARVDPATALRCE